MERSNTDLWANFLANEKLHPDGLPEEWVAQLIRLAEVCGKARPPQVCDYRLKLNSRDFLCETAMDLGIDLPAIRRRGKVAMGRGLLDAWNKVQVRKFGSAVGTVALRETKRRDVVTQLRAAGIAPPKVNRGGVS